MGYRKQRPELPLSGTFPQYPIYLCFFPTWAALKNFRSEGKRCRMQRSGSLSKHHPGGMASPRFATSHLLGLKAGYGESLKISSLILKMRGCVSKPCMQN